MIYDYWVLLGKSVQGGGKSSHEEFLDVIEVLQAYAADICILITALQVFTDVNRADCFALVDSSLAKFMDDIGYEELSVDVLDLMEAWDEELAD